MRARERARDCGPGAAAIRTPGGLLKSLGRFALWALVLLLLFAVWPACWRRTRVHRPRSRWLAPLRRRWPDDAARAFAVGFARAYLSWSPDHADEYARALAPFVSADLARTVAAAVR